MTSPSWQSGDGRAAVYLADAAALPLPDRSVDLVFGSPPYCDARTYGIKAQRGCLEWVEWLMGWPLGWTDLRPLATDRFRQWCELFGF